jgi:nucleoid DNA-binding protein
MVYKDELLRRVWEKVNIGKTGYKDRIKQVEVELVINEFLEELSQCMIDGEDVNLRGFGKFVSNTRKGRIAFDTIHRQKIRLPERRVIKFNISKNVDKYIRGEKRFEVVDE